VPQQVRARITAGSPTRRTRDELAQRALGHHAPVGAIEQSMRSGSKIGIALRRC
jgi:hypothetical protein